MFVPCVSLSRVRLSTIISTHLSYGALPPVDDGRHTVALNSDEVQHGLTGPCHGSSNFLLQYRIGFHIGCGLGSALEDIIDCLILRHMDPKRCDVCGQIFV